MFFGKLLVEPEEVAEASPHSEGLVAEHLQRGLKHGTMELRPILPFLSGIFLLLPGWYTSHDSLNKLVFHLCCYFVGHVSVHPVPWKGIKYIIYE